MAPFSPVTVLGTINQALAGVIKKFNPKVTLRFDLPEASSQQSEPVISVFLYDVHEDLQLRRGESRRLNCMGDALTASVAHICCNYLVTYWEGNTRGGSDSPDSQPDNQAVRGMSNVLQALLNSRQLAGIEVAYTRVAPPQENLGSLGNFWQSLDNRPRLSLMYSITVPMQLENNSQPVGLVEEITSKVVPMALSQKQVNEAIRALLCAKIAQGHDASLAGLAIDSRFQLSRDGQHLETEVWLAGRLEQRYEKALTKFCTHLPPGVHRPWCGYICHPI